MGKGIWGVKEKEPVRGNMLIKMISRFDGFPNLVDIGRLKNLTKINGVSRKESSRLSGESNMTKMG